MTVKISMEESDIIIRKYTDKDYSDLIEVGYPFDSYLTPNIHIRLKNLVNQLVLKLFCMLVELV